jgi:hypothetical protein
MKHDYRVRIVIYDNVNTTPENPDIQADEPLHGEDELAIVAARVGRQFRKKQEAEQ